MLDPIPAVPTEIPGVGVVHAAVPIRLSEQDVSEWAVIVRRTDMPEGREWSTHRVEVLVDEQIATLGNYDLTYEEALADLRDRAKWATPEPEPGPTVPCPSCKVGNVWATFQSEVHVGPFTPSTERPDSDGFLEATCTGTTCAHALLQEPGDGRLRNAYLATVQDLGDALPKPVGDDALEAAWITAVKTLIGEDY